MTCKKNNRGVRKSRLGFFCWFWVREERAKLQVKKSNISHLEYSLRMDVFLAFVNNSYLVTSFPGIKGGWSSKGCKKSTEQKYEGFITCECNHLTNFALLLDVSQRGSKARELSIVTWIGCGVSVIGLVMTVIIYLFFRFILFLFQFFFSVTF